MLHIVNERPSVITPPIPTTLGGVVQSNVLWRVFYPLQEMFREFCIWRSWESGDANS